MHQENTRGGSNVYPCNQCFEQNIFLKKSLYIAWSSFRNDDRPTSEDNRNQSFRCHAEKQQVCFQPVAMDMNHQTRYTLLVVHY